MWFKVVETVFFFSSRRRHTRSKRDWSSDVCSSDLQASSDHVSTHVSYACILAEDFSRKGLVEAMKKRHTYAATDNIVMDVRMGALGMMGDEVRTARPGLDVVVLGTGPIDRVEVIRS